MEEFTAQIRKLIGNRPVRESNSHFAVQIIAVKKGNSKLRICCDLQSLNKITLKDQYSLPYIDDLLDKLDGSRYFTKLDLASVYHQRRIHSEDRDKVTFVIPHGLYKWKIIPFGLANAPATVMHIMYKVLHPHNWYTVVYLHDIVVHSKTCRDHTKHVDTILPRIREARFQLKKAKYTFGVRNYFRGV
jgi:hypothetical protein